MKCSQLMYVRTQLHLRKSLNLSHPQFLFQDLTQADLTDFFSPNFWPPLSKNPHTVPGQNCMHSCLRVLALPESPLLPVPSSECKDLPHTQLRGVPSRVNCFLPCAPVACNSCLYLYVWYVSLPC